ncbi:MAG: DUF1294 domain-containing protein [Candidatus Thermoplasmatota archaeon]
MRPAAIVIWVAASSLAALILCGFDKALAARGGRRISERTLLGAALAGGSPGLILGMLLFRHKTRKGAFLGKLVVVLAAQGALAYVAWRLGRP